MARPRTIIEKKGIYKITSPKGEVYIGQSHRLRRRIMYFQYYINHNRNLYASILKYGWDKHIPEIIHELPKDVSQEVLDTYESLYMQLYKDCGVTLLNIRGGGTSGEHAKETKKIISECTKKQWARSKGRKLKPDGIVKERKKWNPHWLGKKVICSKTGIIYNTIKEAAISFGMTPNALRMQLGGYAKNKTTLNYLT